MRLLSDAGDDVVAAVPDGRSLIAAAVEHRPDLVIVDVRMPPTFTDEGARAAARAARRDPGPRRADRSPRTSSRRRWRSAAARAASATCSRTGCWTSPRFSAQLGASPAAAGRIDPDVVAALVAAQQPRGRAGRAHRPRAPDPRAHGGGPDERRDRAAPRARRAHGRDATSRASSASSGSAAPRTTIVASRRSWPSCAPLAEDTFRAGTGDDRAPRAAQVMSMATTTHTHRSRRRRSGAHHHQPPAALARAAGHSRSQHLVGDHPDGRVRRRRSRRRRGDRAREALAP